MNKNQVDDIVQILLDETRQRGERYTREEVKRKFARIYSKDQIERIVHRYEYLLLQKFESDRNQEDK